MGRSRQPNGVYDVLLMGRKTHFQMLAGLNASIGTKKTRLCLAFTLPYDRPINRGLFGSHLLQGLMIPLRMAYLTSSVRECRFNLRMMFSR